MAETKQILQERHLDPKNSYNLGSERVTQTQAGTGGSEASPPTERKPLAAAAEGPDPGLASTGSKTAH